MGKSACLQGMRHPVQILTAHIKMSGMVACVLTSNIGGQRPVGPDSSMSSHPTQNCELLFQGETVFHVSCQ